MSFLMLIPNWIKNQYVIGKYINQILEKNPDVDFKANMRRCNRIRAEIYLVTSGVSQGDKIAILSCAWGMIEQEHDEIHSLYYAANALVIAKDEVEKQNNNSTKDEK